MSWLFMLLSSIAAYMFYENHHIFLMILSIISVIGCFWSWGIAHNYATEAAKHRSSYTGGFHDFTSEEIDSVPDWITVVNMFFSFLGSILFIISIV